VVQESVAAPVPLRLELLVSVSQGLGPLLSRFPTGTLPLMIHLPRTGRYVGFTSALSSLRRAAFRECVF
jgi:hypothetical protein